MTNERTPTGPEADARIETVRGIFDRYATLALATAKGGEPWVGTVFFVDDEPAPGRFDLCCALIVAGDREDELRATPRVAFCVAGEAPDSWVQGTGRAELVEDQADADAIRKRLCEKSPQAEPFLARVPWRGVRVHVDRLRLVDAGAHPPVAEFTFA